MDGSNTSPNQAGSSRCPRTSTGPQGNPNPNNLQHPTNMTNWQTFPYNRTYNTPAATAGWPDQQAASALPYPYASGYSHWTTSAFMGNTWQDLPEPQSSAQHQDGPRSYQGAIALPPISLPNGNYPSWSSRTWRPEYQEYGAPYNDYSPGASSLNNNPRRQSDVAFNAAAATPATNTASRGPRPVVEQATQEPQAPPTFGQSTSTRTPHALLRRPHPSSRRRLHTADSEDPDSDEENMQMRMRNDEDSEFDLDSLESILGFSGREGFDEERALAAMRGVMAGSGNGKRIPSKEFMATLEPVNPEELPVADRSCIICYNEFGVKNPEGLSEDPIRLPKCRHVFGHTCIKKWFDENDSCPYCRDKIPSESVRKMLYRHARQLYQHSARAARLNFASASATTAPDENGSGGLFANQAAAYSYFPVPTREMLANQYTNTSRLPDTVTEVRRRLPRGRAGSHRANYHSTRSNNSNSPRLHLPIAPQTQNGRAAFQFTPHSTYNHPRRYLAREREAVEGSEGVNRMAGHASLRHMSNVEGVSPAIAIGSGTNNGNQQATPIPISPSSDQSNSVANSDASAPRSYPIFGSMDIVQPMNSNDTNNVQNLPHHENL